MMECEEPRCEEYADFEISHNGYAFHFCTKHIWFRVQRWLGRFPKGEQVFVASLSGKAETPPSSSGTMRDMQSDGDARELVVQRPLDFESTEDSSKGTNQTVTTGEMPAMRKPARKSRTKVPLRDVSK
jgi:hypothetical protein